MIASALTAILNRPRSVLTLLIVMVIAGMITYITIPKEAQPDIDIPVFYVSIPFQGISPEDANRLLVKPMEAELRGLEGLKEIQSFAAQGHAAIVLEFLSGTDHEKASREIREKVDRAKAKLPPNRDEPTVHEINFSLFPVIVVAISGDLPERTLFSLARKLQDQLEAIPSVLEVKLKGHREELLEVEIDPARLESYNISQRQLITTITRNNQLIAAGTLYTPKGRFSVKVPGLIETPEDVYNLPVLSTGEAVVTLGQIATIRRTFKDQTSYSRFNGKPALILEIVKRTGTNIIETNRQVRKLVTAAAASWPANVEVGFALDQSKLIFEILGSLQSAIMTAIALVMIVIVAVLGPRSALLVGLAIPASFMIGFLLIGLFGLSVNMMLMFGLVLTVGILVDGAIVIVEYADRKIADGLPRDKAYILAAQRMFWPIVSSTATTLAAFLPLLFWPGVAGQFMSLLPITVIVVLTAALITALIFLPVLGRYLGRKQTTAAEREAAKQLSGTTRTDDLKLAGLSGAYLRFLKRAIAHPIRVMIVSVGLIITVIAAFSQWGRGVEFFVDTEPEQAIIFVSARGNLSPAEQLALVQQVEEQVLAVEGLAAVFTTIGGGNDITAQFQGAGQDSPVDKIGTIIIELKDFNDRRPGKEILAEIRQRVKTIPGIVVEVRKREDGPPTGKDIRLQVLGPEWETVLKVTRKLRQKFEQDFEDLRDIEDTSPQPGIEWVIEVDRREAGRFGTDIATIGAMVQLVTNGILLDTYRPDDSEDEVEIRIRYPAPMRHLSELDRLRVLTNEGLVPLHYFVTRRAKPKVSTIARSNGRYSMYVKANVGNGVLPSEKIREISQWLKTQHFPTGIETKFRGADEEQKEAGAFLGKAMAGALFLMFMILVTQFNSFYQTFITLLTVVLSVVGVLAGMLITHQTFSIIMTGTGVVALAGIVVNNSIVLIDTFNRFRAQELDAVEAAIHASAQRLRPVLLTTVTTIFGLLPMALQVSLDFFDRKVIYGTLTSFWWVQLSTAIIFGLTFATLLTLVLTPTLLAAPQVLRGKHPS